jgi:tRNA A37 threonylcarbamoyltransferase TsaD
MFCAIKIIACYMSITSTPIYFPATADLHEAVRTLDYPLLALLVSGVYCQLLKCLGVGKYVILGGTIDDSLGTYGEIIDNFIML